MLWVGIVAGWLAGLVLHEAGHAVAAAILGLAVQRITIGLGPRLTAIRCVETTLELRSIPLAGFVSVYWLHETGRLRRLIYVASGPFVNFLLFVLGNWVNDQSPWYDFSFGFALAQIALLSVGLFPHMAWLDGNKVPSDGLRLWQLITGFEKQLPNASQIYETLFRAYCADRMPRPPKSQAAQRILYQISRPEIADLMDRRTSWAALMRELARGNLRPWEEAGVLDHLVTSGLMTGEPMLRALSDEWSARALALAPRAATLNGSRGSVLVELGRHEEGKLCLQRVSDEAPPFDVFLSRGFEAKADSALGNFAAAQSAMSKARAAFALLPKSDRNLAMLTRFELETAGEPAG